MLRPPSAAIRSSGLRPPAPSGLRPPMPSSQQQHQIRRVAPQPSPAPYQQAKTAHRQTSRPSMSSTRDPPVQSRPSIFPRNQAHTPMPSAARRTSTGLSRQSNVHKQNEQYGDENSLPASYSIKQACDRLGYDYRHLMEEKRRIGYTGPGLIVPERTEVDEILLKNIDVPFGIWLYKYVRLYPGEPLAENLNERQYVPERLDQNEVINIVRPTNRNQRQTTRILDLFGDKSNTISQSTENTNEINAKSQMPPPPLPPVSNEFRFARSTTVLAISDEVNRSPRRLPHHQNPQQLSKSVLKRSQTQILNAKLDNDSFDRDTQIRIRELKCSAIGQEFMEQLERLRSIDDPDLFTIKISMFDAAIQRIEKILKQYEQEISQLKKTHDEQIYKLCSELEKSSLLIHKYKLELDSMRLSAYLKEKQFQIQNKSSIQNLQTKNIELKTELTLLTTKYQTLFNEIQDARQYILNMIASLD